jgi:hypothetical protein
MPCPKKGIEKPNRTLFFAASPGKKQRPAILNAGFRCSGQEKAAVDIIQMAGVVAFF